MQHSYSIIRLVAASKRYYPSYLSHESWMSSSYINSKEYTIPLGQSRYGGPIMDVPAHFTPPNDLYFAGQLNLNVLAKEDGTDLLPKTGHLYFFADIRKNIGKVFYFDIATEALIRHTHEHEQTFWYGVLIDDGVAETELWEDRYKPVEDEDDLPYANADGNLWDSFEGSNISKIFGIFTHCQKSEQEITSLMEKDLLVLCQIGENGFNDEGVFSVLIPKQDLIHLNFDNCSFYWGQT